MVRVSSEVALPAAAAVNLPLPNEGRVATEEAVRGGRAPMAITPRKQSAFGGTLDESATKARVDIDTSAKTVVVPIPPAVTVPTPDDNLRARRVRSEASALASRRPRYARGFVWGASEISDTPSASFTERADPVPSVPFSDLRHLQVTETIASNSSLFLIITPIRHDIFRALLFDHPNPLLVNSICNGIQYGFWPYADLAGLDSAVPITLDRGFAREPPPEEVSFLCETRDNEMAVNRFSPPFASLLPGMVVGPYFSVPKPGSDKRRLVTDHSAGDQSLNSFIPIESGHIRVDTLIDLVKCIRAEMGSNGGQPPRWIFKSDASTAFRLLPMHPRWQMRQIVRIDGAYHVDRNAVFGNRASMRIWCLFFGLVTWIAIKHRQCPDLLHYVDDSFGVDWVEGLVPYAAYEASYPAKQVQLLRLWDEIGLPHAKPKQLYGRELVIIGFFFSLDTMTITMPVNKKAEIVALLRDFIRPISRRRTLHEFQVMLGSANWALNVFPLLRPGLSSSYAKTAGKTLRNAGIPLNRDVISDLSWFADRMEVSDGIHVLQVTEWGKGDADLEIWCDASKLAIAFYSRAHRCAYVSPLDEDQITSSGVFRIFFNEALAVVSALAWASRLANPPRRLIIHSDSINTVQIFHSLRASQEYNQIIFLAVQILMDSDIELRVLHIVGADNVIADHVSRLMFDAARQLHPGLIIRSFMPPRDELAVHQL